MIHLFLKLFIIGSFFVSAGTVENSIEELKKIEKQARVELSKVEDLSYQIKANRVVISGTVIMPGDLNKVWKFADKHGKKVSSLVVMKPKALKALGNLIQKDIREQLEVNDILVKVTAKNYILDGSVLIKEQKDKALKIAAVYIVPGSGVTIINNIKVMK